MPRGKSLAASPTVCPHVEWATDHILWHVALLPGSQTRTLLSCLSLWTVPGILADVFARVQQQLGCGSPLCHLHHSVWRVGGVLSAPLVTEVIGLVIALLVEGCGRCTRLKLACR